MKFIITGGAGFIGSNLAKFLVRKGHKIIIIDDFSSGKMSNLKGIIKKINIIKSDILNLNKIKSIDNVDCLFHLAAKTSVLESIKNPKKYLKVNYTGTKSVIDFIKRSKIKKIIFSASASCYGNTNKLPISEGQKIKPKNPYAKSKYMAEKYIKKNSSKNKFNYISFRLFNIFGPNTDKSSPYSSVLTNFFNQFNRKLPLTIYGDGNQTRDFLHVEDLCKCFYIGAQKVKKNYIFNLGSGKRLSIINLANLISHKIIHKKAIKNEIRDSESNISKVKKALKWKPQISIYRNINKLKKKL